MAKSTKVKTGGSAEQVHEEVDGQSQIALIHTDCSFGFYDASNVGDICNFARKRIGRAVATLKIEGEDAALLLAKAGLERSFSSGLPPNPVANTLAMVNPSHPICGDAVAVGIDADGGYTGLKAELVEWLKENAPKVTKIWQEGLAAMEGSLSDVTGDNEDMDGMGSSDDLSEVSTTDLIKELVYRKVKGDEDCLIIRLYTKQDLKVVLEKFEYPVTEENVNKLIERIEVISQLLDRQAPAAFHAAVEAFCEKEDVKKEDDKSNERKKKKGSRAKEKPAGKKAAIPPEAGNADCEG